MVKKLINIFMFVLIVFMLTGCGGDSGSTRVLIVDIASDKTGSYGMDAFETALKKGGQLTITLDEITGAYPEFEKKYALFDKDRMYYTNGALINFIADKGWEYYSNDFGYLVFKKK